MNQKYTEKKHDTEFTTYDFISLFSAMYANNKNYSFNKDNLILFIKLCKDSFKFTKLTKDITLQEEIDESISKLKWAKVLYTIPSEKDSTIHIYKNITIAKIIKPRIDYLEEMYDFIHDYNKFENEIINKYYKKLAEQETKNINKKILKFPTKKNNLLLK